MLKVKAIAAMDHKRVIGWRNSIPWRLPGDLPRFKRLTMGDAVLMGRLTYESLPANSRPLVGRKNVLVTSHPDRFTSDDVELCSDPLCFIEECKLGKRRLESDTLWVIGGEKIYRATLPCWDELYLTLVEGEHEGDAFFPPFEEQFTLVEELPANGCSYLRFLRDKTA